jgi:putative endonuclease
VKKLQNYTKLKMRKYEFFVYIMSSISKVLYVGVTSHLYGRVEQHKSGLNDGFTKKYQCNKLVYYEEYQYVDEAIIREKQIKKWRREKKEDLIKNINPEWHDLSIAMDVENTDFSTSSQPIHTQLRSK